MSGRATRLRCLNASDKKSMAKPCNYNRHLWWLEWEITGNVAHNALVKVPHVEAYLCHLIPLMVGHITWSLRGHVLMGTSKRGMPRAAGRTPWRVSNRLGPFFTVGITNIATKDL